MDEYPKPIHDYTDKSAYSKPSDGSGWAWEFLRRNEHYQRFIDGVLDRSIISDQVLQECGIYDNAMHSELPTKIVETYHRYSLISAVFGVADSSKIYHYLEKTGPTTWERPRVLNSHGPWHIQYGEKVSESPVSELLDELAKFHRMICFGFDIGAELGPQLKHVEKILKRLAENQRVIASKHQPNSEATLPARRRTSAQRCRIDHLRMLDALATGANEVDLTHNFDSISISDVRNTAERLRDDDYWLLNDHLETFPPPYNADEPEKPIFHESENKKPKQRRRRKT